MTEILLQKYEDSKSKPRKRIQKQKSPQNSTSKEEREKTYLEH